jgi:hypothetical protein
MAYSRPFMVAAAILTGGVLAALCVLAPRMYPLHADTPANFWYAATRVDLGATRRRADYVIVDRDRLVYGSQYPFATYFDLPYETLPLTAAQVEFPRVLQELSARAALNDPDDYIAAAYVRWTAQRGMSGSIPERAGGIPDLLNCIEQARTEWVARKSPPPFVSEDYRNFNVGLVHVSEAARLYWATFLFEACFFTALIVLAFRPYIRRASLRRKLLRVAVVPFLLYLPMWFGYCNSASSSYPVGGILYPFVNSPDLAIFKSTPFSWEWNLLKNLPPFFIVITQGRAVSYSDYDQMKSSIPYQMGPLNVAALSFGLTLLVAAFHAVPWIYRKLRPIPRGFPVLEPHGTPQVPAE